VKDHARIAAFADGELDPEAKSTVEAHLATCARCVRELEVQHAISGALAGEPVPEASARLRRSIERLGADPHRNRRRAAFAAAAMAVIGLALALPRRSPVIPAFHDAVADCRRVMGRNFPRRADLRATGEGLPFAIHPLDKPGAELFSTWKTTIGGLPAAGLAYRWRGRVVVQYAVPADLVRREPRIAEAVRTAGFYAASDGGQVILAILADGSATLLVGDAPAAELARLAL
jgi:anti-sigma factor RsiW